jgi:hypothetical protein
MYTTKKE